MKLSMNLILIILLIPMGAQAQDFLLKRHVFGSGGGHVTEGEYYFNLTIGEQVIDLSENDTVIANFGFWGRRNIVTGVEDDEDVFLQYVYALGQNYPNPFNPKTTIAYSIGEGKPVSVHIRIYNVRGALVKTLVNEMKEPGEYRVLWDGLNDKEQEVATGIYFYHMRAGSFIQTKKLLILK